MIDFSKCKTTKDYEKVLLDKLRTYKLGTQPLSCLFPTDEIETECCGLCDHENEVPFRHGCYVSRCENCGEKMRLCSRCLYDDPNHVCNWNPETKTCWRG